MFDFFKRKKPSSESVSPPFEPSKDAPTPPKTENTAEIQASSPPAEQKPIDDAPPTNAPRSSWQTRLSESLFASRKKLSSALNLAFTRRTLDEETLEELETALLSTDAGVNATTFLLDTLRARYAEKNTEVDIKVLLREVFVELLLPLQPPAPKNIALTPHIVMLTGVNGAGKTTSIGKLAHHWQKENRSVLLAAGDTFRAAAGEQLLAWGAQNNVSVIFQQGGDPAAVIFDAINAARARKVDVVLADTAGRLPTQNHLMDELKKIKRVIARAEENAPHEVLLVLDANTGQNGLAQVKAFDDAVNLTGLIVTKLDGSAKGGVLAAIAKERPIPVFFIGVGEGVDDLQPFDVHTFVEALLP